MGQPSWQEVTDVITTGRPPLPRIVADARESFERCARNGARVGADRGTGEI